MWVSTCTRQPRVATVREFSGRIIVRGILTEAAALLEFFAALGLRPRGPTGSQGAHAHPYENSSSLSFRRAGAYRANVDIIHCGPETTPTFHPAEP
jgi:hypothetical protein